MKDRMPYVADGPDGPLWAARTGRRSVWSAASGPAARRYVPGPELPGRHDGGDRPLRRRQEGHPPPGRSAPAHQGHGSRRRARRGDLRHPRRGHAAERPRGRQRDAPHLQRLAGGLLPPLSRPPHRPGVPAVRRHRRRGRGGPSRGQDGLQGHRALVLVGHGAHVASAVGAAVAGGQRGRTCRCTSTRSRRCRRSCARSTPGSRAAPRCSPASACSR